MELAAAYKKLTALGRLAEFAFQTSTIFMMNRTSTDEASDNQGPGKVFISRKKLAKDLEKEVEHTPPILLLLFLSVKEASPPYTQHCRLERACY